MFKDEFDYIFLKIHLILSWKVIKKTILSLCCISKC